MVVAFLALLCALTMFLKTCLWFCSKPLLEFSTCYLFYSSFSFHQALLLSSSQPSLAGSLITSWFSRCALNRIGNCHLLLIRELQITNQWQLE